MTPPFRIVLTAACAAGLAAAEGPGESEPPAAKGRIVEFSPSLRLDLENKEVVVDAEVALTEGPLELLLCPRRTKEHESILAADVDPRAFYVALNQIAEPGSPVQYEPEFAPPKGQAVRIEVEWEHAGKVHRCDARRWIRQAAENPKDVRELSADFVFAGSRFVRAPGQSRLQWLGDEGYLVCVSNFPGAIVDVSMKSDSSNAALLFEAWTDRIPPKGTKVRVSIRPEADRGR
jgi:hypothetical protein